MFTKKTNMVSDDNGSVRRVPAPRVGRCRPAALLRTSAFSSAPSSPSRALQSLSELSSAPSSPSRALQSLSVLLLAPSDSSRASQSLPLLSLAPSDSSRASQSLSALSPAPSDSSRQLQSQADPSLALACPPDSPSALLRSSDSSPVPRGSSDPPSSLLRLPSFRDLVGSTHVQFNLLLIDGGGFEVQSLDEKDIEEIRVSKDVFAKPTTVGYKLVRGETLPL